MSQHSPDHVMEAAAAAVQAGCGAGADAPGDASGRVRLRARARAWLEREVKIAEDYYASRAATRPNRPSALDVWKKDPRFAPVRADPAAECIGEEELAEWRELWRRCDRVIGDAAVSPDYS